MKEEIIPSPLLRDFIMWMNLSPFTGGMTVAVNLVYTKIIFIEYFGFIDKTKEIAYKKSINIHLN